MELNLLHRFLVFAEVSLCCECACLRAKFLMHVSVFSSSVPWCSEVRSNVWSRPGGCVGNEGKLTLLRPLSITERQVSILTFLYFFDLEMAGILIKFY